jgi:hypothetical protein
MLISGVFTLIGYVTIKNAVNIPSIFAMAISLGASIYLCIRLFGKPGRKTIIQEILIIAILFGIVKFFAFMFSIVTPYVKEGTFTEEDSVVKTIYIENQDTISVFRSNRIWRDNYGNDYSGSLTIRERDYFNLKDYIKKYTPPSSDNFWGNLYDHIDRNDTPSLDLVLQTFEAINAEKQLNQMEFAEMVVSCIQDIPYAFVFQDACLPAHSYEESIRELLERCPNCCIGNVVYGIQNPVSFLQNLKGDCDTRTVLIYSVLKYFKYDVAILNSDFYRHSIIGINLPAGGLFKTYNGKRYMLWETTAKYFEVGKLPPSFDNVSHWNVVLTSK